MKCNCPMCGEPWNGERCGNCGWKEPGRSPAVPEGEEETPSREWLLRRVAFYARECERLRSAIRWALGEEGGFDDEEPPPLAGKYRGRFWWRKELRERAFGSAGAPSPAPLKCTCPSPEYAYQDHEPFCSMFSAVPAAPERLNSAGAQALAQWVAEWRAEAAVVGDLLNRIDAILKERQP